MSCGYTGLLDSMLPSLLAQRIPQRLSRVLPCFKGPMRVAKSPLKSSTRKGETVANTTNHGA
jgi:hypothetical protein